MPTKQEIEKVVTEALGESAACPRDTKSNVILELDRRYRDLRDLLDRALVAGVNWDFGGDLKTDVQRVLDRHDGKA